jgi:site-specific recombinase XerD
MDTQNRKLQKWTLASIPLQDSFTDFLLSRQAMMCTPRTIQFYEFTLGKISEWFERNDIHQPNQITSRQVRAMLAELVEKGYSDSYINIYARVIRTFTKFLYKEKYIFEKVEFDMPKIRQKRLPVFSKMEIQQILSACKIHKDKTLILFMVDSGLRQAEVIGINWGDIDISSGIVRVEKGKGGKARSVIIGVHTRRALLRYRREVDSSEKKPVFQTRDGGRYTTSGFRSWTNRISKRVNIHISAHALRRSFATLSLKAGMPVFQLQGLLGHSSLEMTRHYVKLLEEDLIIAHKEHGPIDNIIKK